MLGDSAVPTPLKCVENTRLLHNKLDFSALHPSLVIKQRSIINAHMKTEANSAGPRVTPALGASSFSSAEVSLALRGAYFLMTRTLQAHQILQMPQAPQTHPTNKLYREGAQATALGNSLSSICKLLIRTDQARVITTLPWPISTITLGGRASSASPETLNSSLELGTLGSSSLTLNSLPVSTRSREPCLSESAAGSATERASDSTIDAHDKGMGVVHSCDLSDMATREIPLVLKSLILIAHT
jgi:hypothetical protein